MNANTSRASLITGLAVFASIIFSSPLFATTVLYSENFNGQVGNSLANAPMNFDISAWPGTYLVTSTAEMGDAFDYRAGGGFTSTLAPPTTTGQPIAVHPVPAFNAGATSETWSMDMYFPTGSFNQQFVIGGNAGGPKAFTGGAWADLSISGGNWLLDTWTAAGANSESIIGPATLLDQIVHLSIVANWGAGTFTGSINNGAGGSASLPMDSGAQNSLSFYALIGDNRNIAVGGVVDNFLVTDNTGAVPEPSSVVLLGLGAIGLAMIARGRPIRRDSK